MLMSKQKNSDKEFVIYHSRMKNFAINNLFNIHHHFNDLLPLELI